MAYCANQVWSVAGDRRRVDVNQMFLQPFLSYPGDPYHHAERQFRNDGQLGGSRRRALDRSDSLPSQRNWTSSGRFPPAISWAWRAFRSTRIWDPRGTSEEPSSFCCPKRSKRLRRVSHLHEIGRLDSSKPSPNGSSGVPIPFWLGHAPESGPRRHTRTSKRRGRGLVPACSLT